MRKFLFFLAISSFIHCALYDSASRAAEVRFEGYGIATTSCKQSREDVDLLCVPQGKSIIRWEPIVTAKSEKSDYKIEKTPDRPECLTLTSKAVPEGEMCRSFLNAEFCACKGTGWIRLNIKVQTTD